MWDQQLVIGDIKKFLMWDLTTTDARLGSRSRRDLGGKWEVFRVCGKLVETHLITLLPTPSFNHGD